MPGRLIGYLANRADRLADALSLERGRVSIPPSAAPSGYGLGFYQGGEILHKKRPLSDRTELEWSQIARGVNTDCAIFHLRHATVGTFSAENTHPFRMRSWLFAHNGTIEQFDRLRGAFREEMPDFIQRNVRGQTDSEHFFHLILAKLHARGQLDRTDADEQAVTDAIASTVSTIDRLANELGNKPPVLNSVLTNGRQMFGLRRGNPMTLAERSVDSAPESRDRLPPFRYAMIVGGPDSSSEGYVDIAENSVVFIDRDLRVQQNRL